MDSPSGMDALNFVHADDYANKQYQPTIEEDQVVRSPLTSLTLSSFADTLRSPLNTAGSRDQGRLLQPETWRRGSFFQQGLFIWRIKARAVKFKI